MRKVFLAMIALSMISSLSAEEKKKDVCPILAETAEVVMMYRQGNTSMRKSMKLFITKGAGDSWNAITKTIIMDAYSQPRFMGKTYKQNAITDFENKWYLKCLEANK